MFRIQIGAPRGNDTKLHPDVREPGVVFRCLISEPCHAVKFDTAGKLATELIILFALFDYGAYFCRKYICLHKRSFYLFIYLFMQSYSWPNVLTLGVYSWGNFQAEMSNKCYYDSSKLQIYHYLNVKIIQFSCLLLMCRLTAMRPITETAQET